MIKFKDVVQTIKTPDIITCNKCGKEFQEKDKNDFTWNNLIHSFGIHFSYGSSYDDERWQFELCENCLVELINSFIIPVNKDDPFYCYFD